MDFKAKQVGEIFSFNTERSISSFGVIEVDVCSSAYTRLAIFFVAGLIVYNNSPQLKLI